jgi:hypothetical protein
VAAEDGLKLSNEKPLLFLGAVFGIGFVAGLIATRAGMGAQSAGQPAPLTKVTPEDDLQSLAA